MNGKRVEEEEEESGHTDDSRSTTLVYLNNIAR